MSREVLKPITLSDGTILPKGLQISMPSHQVNMDEKLWERPDEFDGFRFDKMRATAGNENKFQFVTTGFVLPLTLSSTLSLFPLTSLYHICKVVRLTNEGL